MVENYFSSNVPVVSDSLLDFTLFLKLLFCKGKLLILSVAMDVNSFRPIASLQFFQFKVWRQEWLSSLDDHSLQMIEVSMKDFLLQLSGFRERWVHKLTEVVYLHEVVGCLPLHIIQHFGGLLLELPLNDVYEVWLDQVKGIFEPLSAHFFVQVPVNHSELFLDGLWVRIDIFRGQKLVKTFVKLHLLLFCCVFAVFI